ncbi:hypothetical protein EYR40_008257 [Pleurotus pulmonarius]|nr:hypothetical protein EYR36_009079 [Pleurotus pulmonarius]KAF4597790.1 hypothetical protein EYR40_008257 [Pleurotus pulmonarius]
MISAMSCLNQDSYLELPQHRTRSKQLPTELIDRVISLLEEYTDDERARYRGRMLARVAANALRARALNTAKPYWACHHIQLPNLDSLFCDYTRDHYPAPCIPATVSELAVKVSANSAPPRFSPAIRLCTLTIDVCPTRRTSLYPSVVLWIRRCIDQLPCPNDLRRLNIRIMNTSRIWLPKPCYPARADYESLYETLWPLHQDGALTHLDLTVEVNASEIASDRIVHPVYRTRAEVAIEKEVWGPVLGTGEVVVDLTFELTTSTRELVVLKYRL